MEKNKQRAFLCSTRSTKNELKVDVKVFDRKRGESTHYGSPLTSEAYKRRRIEILEDLPSDFTVLEKTDNHSRIIEKWRTSPTVSFQDLISQLGPKTSQALIQRKQYADHEKTYFSIMIFEDGAGRLCVGLADRFHDNIKNVVKNELLLKNDPSPFLTQQITFSEATYRLLLGGANQSINLGTIAALRGKGIGVKEIGNLIANNEEGKHAIDLSREVVFQLNKSGIFWLPTAIPQCFQDARHQSHFEKHQMAGGIQYPSDSLMHFLLDQLVQEDGNPLFSFILKNEKVDPFFKTVFDDDSIFGYARDLKLRVNMREMIRFYPELYRLYLEKNSL